MAQKHVLAGTPVKRRHPLAPLGLSIITLGIYHLVWYYKVNRELKGVTGQGNPVVSLLAVTFGVLLLLIPPLVSWFNTAERIRVAQDRAGVSSPISAVLALVLLFIPFANLLAAAYLQSGLNRAWEQMAGAHSGEAAGPPGPVELPAAPVAEQG